MIRSLRGLLFLMLIFANIYIADAQEIERKPLSFQFGGGVLVNNDFGYSFFNALQIPLFKSIGIAPSINYCSSALYNFEAIEYDIYEGGMLTHIATTSNNTYSSVNGDFLLSFDLQLYFAPLELLDVEALKNHQLVFSAGGGYRHFMLSYIYFQLIREGIYKPYYFYQYVGSNFDYSFNAKYYYQFSEKWYVGAGFSTTYFAFDKAASARLFIGRNLR